MIKRIYLYTLPEGADPDKAWKYHVQCHARDGMKAMGPRLKKYVLNRVARVTNGKPTFFALVETWYDSEEDMNQAMEAVGKAKTEDGRPLGQDWAERIATSWSAVVEEYIGK